jgi:hypothetical protein
MAMGVLTGVTAICLFSYKCWAEYKGKAQPVVEPNKTKNREHKEKID